MIEATRGLKPGAALDAAMGQGRNALYLAQVGWNVTGFDVSEVGTAAARARATLCYSCCLDWPCVGPPPCFQTGTVMG